MKKLYITLSFVIASGILSAQNKDTKTADKLFDRYEYTEAANEYLKLVEKEKADNYVYKQLADSYYNIFISLFNFSKHSLRVTSPISQWLI